MEEPRPHNPIPLEDLHGPSSDEFSDDTYPNYEADDGASSSDEEVSDQENEGGEIDLELKGEGFSF